MTVVRWPFGGLRRPDGVMRPPGKERMSLVMVPPGTLGHGDPQVCEEPLGRREHYMSVTGRF